MKYKLETCVWEITLGCNFRCRHCGSSCAEPAPDELTTEEALDLADQIGVLKPRYLSLTGGEPLMRKDWSLITERLTAQGIQVCMITNGSLIDEETAEKMERAGLSLVSVSMDGTRQIHNYMRGVDCYDKSKRAYRLLSGTKILRAANTTLVKENLSCLEEMRLELMELGVQKWQLQIGLPVGTLKKNKASVIDPEDLPGVIDFVYEANSKGGIQVTLAESAGYYSKKEAMAARMADPLGRLSVFRGCNAGIRSLGILQNGDVTGCTSIRDPRFIEGTVRKRPLWEIWQDEQAFAWRRQMTVQKEQQGFCGRCPYAEVCLGGCTNTKLTTAGSIYKENRYCVYHLAHACQNQT